VPYAAAGPANAAMAAVSKAALDNQLLLIIMGNRVHVTPPLNLSDEDASTGLQRLDAVLAAADAQL